MIKKTVTWVDFDGIERTEDFYFHFSEAELSEMTLTMEGGFKKTVERIIQAQNVAELTKIFKKILLDSYGEKSLDGRQFVKNDEVRNKLLYSGAYNKMFMELAFNDELASAFINDVIKEIEKKPAEVQPVKK